MHRHRHPHIGAAQRVDPLKAAGRHTDDREALAVERDRLADDGLVGREASLPQRVAEDGDRVGAVDLVLLEEKVAAEGRLDAERLKIVRRPGAS